METEILNKPPVYAGRVIPPIKFKQTCVFVLFKKKLHITLYLTLIIPENLLCILRKVPGVCPNRLTFRLVDQ